MEYTILDLEWNNTYSRKLDGFFNEIIQFGAVRLNEKLEEIDRFTTFVAPQEGKKLTGMVEQLTNISIEDLKSGLPFPEAFKQFCAFARGSLLLTWGDCDLRELISNYRYYTGKIELPLKVDYVNLQEYCQLILGQPLSRQMGLSDAAEQLQIQSDGIALHRAIDDSILSAECLRRTYHSERLAERIIPLDTELCRRLSFKNKFLTDRNHPLIDPTQLEFVCPLCRGQLKTTEPWSIHNKQFFRRFQCPACDKKFKARVQFKQKYDGVQVKRNITEDRPKPEAEAVAHADP